MAPSRFEMNCKCAVQRILNQANDVCLMLNPSVNAYRRLDPHYEAPNQIMVKVAEIQFHHEVTNQFLWSLF